LEVKKHFNISKNCFYPKPKVDSVLLSFKPIKKIKYQLKNPKHLEEITRIFFSNRRKMINKPITKIFKNTNIVKEKFNLDLKLRPEDLDKEIYYKMAKEYEELFG
jgi:16S rRNA (adenine1518-N6/adenine1519-N6)-dimethyltransferase